MKFDTDRITVRFSLEGESKNEGGPEFVTLPETVVRTG